MKNFSAQTTVQKIKSGYPLFLFNVLFLSILFVLTILRGNVLLDMNLESWLYFIPASLGHSLLFALVPYFIYIFLIQAIRKTTIPVYIYATLVILLSVFLLFDSFAFNIYRFHINDFVFDLLFGAGGDVFIFGWKLVVKAVLAILLLIVLPYCLFFRFVPRIIKWFTKKGIVISFSVLLFFLVSSHLVYAYSSATRHVAIERSATVLPYFYPLTINTLLAKLGVEVAEEIEGLTYNTSIANLNYPLNPITTDTTQTNYSILHIVIDSWNPTVFDSIVTPNMYKFAQKSSFYNNHFSNHCATSGGVFGMFFGTPFAYDQDFEISQRTPLFIDQIVDNNYEVGVFSSATLLKPPFNKRLFRRIPDINVTTEGATPYDRDNKITELTIDFLREQNDENPFYAFMFYDLPHAISIPAEHRTKFTPSWSEPDYMKLTNTMDRTPFFNLYKNCVYHVDYLIGTVLDELTTLDLLDNTIVLITADHGQEFNENKKNYWGHTSNYSDWQLKVPLILYEPNKEGGQVYNHMTTHYDLTPTLMSRHFGVTNPMGDYSIGYDLDSLDCRFPILVGSSKRFGFVFEDLIITTNEVGKTTLTDRQLNPVGREKLDIVKLKEAMRLKNKFYK